MSQHLHETCFNILFCIARIKLDKQTLPWPVTKPLVPSMGSSTLICRADWGSFSNQWQVTHTLDNFCVHLTSFESNLTTKHPKSKGPKHVLDPHLLPNPHRYWSRSPPESNLHLTNTAALKIVLRRGHILKSSYRMLSGGKSQEMKKWNDQLQKAIAKRFWYNLWLGAYIIYIYVYSTL